MDEGPSAKTGMREINHREVSELNISYQKWNVSIHVSEPIQANFSGGFTTLISV